MNISVFIWTYSFCYLDSISRSDMVGSYGRFRLNFLKRLPSCLPEGCMIFRFPVWEIWTPCVYWEGLEWMLVFVEIIFCFDVWVSGITRSQRKNRICFLWSNSHKIVSAFKSSYEISILIVNGCWWFMHSDRIAKSWVNARVRKKQLKIQKLGLFEIFNCNHFQWSKI